MNAQGATAVPARHTAGRNRRRNKCAICGAKNSQQSRLDDSAIKDLCAPPPSAAPTATVRLQPQKGARNRRRKARTRHLVQLQPKVAVGHVERHARLRRVRRQQVPPQRLAVDVVREPDRRLAGDGGVGQAAREAREAGGPGGRDVDAERRAVGVEPAVGGAAEAADGRVLEGRLANAVAADAVGEDVADHLAPPAAARARIDSGAIRPSKKTDAAGEDGPGFALSLVGRDVPKFWLCIAPQARRPGPGAATGPEPARRA